MINPDDLVQAWLDRLRDIAPLVAALGGSEATIQGYFDRFPSQSNLRNALMQMPPGSLMVVFMGTDKVRVGSAFQFRHSFSFQLKAPESSEQGVSYGALWSMFVNSAPATNNPGNLPLLHFTIHDGCYPMDLELPRAQRSSILTGVDGSTLDLFEIQASLIETGDNRG